MSRMNKKEFTFIIACYVQGSFLYTMYYYHVVENEVWITLLCGALVGVLMACVYGSLSKAYPGKSLVQINESVFGRIPGKIISLFYVYTFFLSCSRMLRESSQFVSSNLLMGFEWTAILLMLVLLCAWAANYGVKYLSSVSAFLCIFMYAFTALMFILLIPYSKLSYLMPIGDESMKEYTKAFCISVSQPFSELIALLMIAPEMRGNHDKSKGYLKEFLTGILIGVPFFLIIVLRDITVLGPLVSDLAYPGYEVVRLINYNIFSNIESLYGVIAIFIMFFKSAVLFFCISKALGQIFECRKNIVFVPFTAGLLMLGAQKICSSNIELIDIVINRITYVLLAVQIGIPLITLAVCKIKKNIQYKCKGGDVMCG